MWYLIPGHVFSSQLKGVSWFVCQVFPPQDIEPDSLPWRSAWPETGWDDHKYLLGMSEPDKNTPNDCIKSKYLALCFIHDFLNQCNRSSELLEVPPQSSPVGSSQYGLLRQLVRLQKILSLYSFWDNWKMWIYLSHYPGFVKIPLLRCCEYTSDEVLWLTGY